MVIISIDPGTSESAYALIENGVPIDTYKIPNHELIRFLEDRMYDITVAICERIRCMGMAVGAETLETAEWTGRFQQTWIDRGAGMSWHWVTRSEEKMALCGNPRAKDANIRQAIIDRYGGKDLAIGKKANPGPLYGVSGDCWSSIAVGLTWLDLQKAKVA